MIMLDDKVFRAQRTYTIRGYGECRTLLDSLPHWAMSRAPEGLEAFGEGLGEALVADYEAALVIYDLGREHAFVVLNGGAASVRLESDLPMTIHARP